MPDIAKCHGKGCASKNTCYRYTSPRSTPYQSFASFDDKPQKKCEYYIKTKNL